MSTGSGRVYGGLTADERMAQRREQLIAAGLELFGTRGYRATTVEAICAQAGLSPRYFYEQFKSREQLLGTVYDRHLQRITDRVTTAVAEVPPDPRQRLETGLRAFLEGVIADERGARVNYFEMGGVSRELERKRRDALDAYADMIASQIAEIDRVRPVPVRDQQLASVALVAATDGLITHWLTGERARSPEELIETVLDVVDAVLG